MIRPTKSPFLVLALLSLISVATQGVDTFSHLVYNLWPLELLQNKSFRWGASIFSNPESLEYHYITHIVPWLKFGVVAIVAAVVVRFIAFYLVYKICLLCINQKSQALVTTFLFMIPVAFSAHGVVVNGLWGPPALFPATLSALFTLAGLLLFLRTGALNKLEMSAENQVAPGFSFISILEQKSTLYVLAGLAFALSIQFHGLYGITAFAWIFIGSLMILASRGWRDWNWFLVQLIIVIGSVAYVAYLSFGSNTPATIKTTLSEWFRFICIVDVDDVSLLYSLGYAGYGLLPLIFSGTYFAFKKTQRTDIEHLQLGMFYTLLIFLSIEIFHQYGVFFGKISEYFIGAQLRRGIWVMALLSLIILVKNHRIIQDSLHKKHAMLLVALGLVTFAAPAVATVVLFLSVAAYTHPRNQFIYFLLIVAIGASIVHVYHGYINIAIEVKSLILFIVSILILYFLKITNRESINSTITYVSLMIVLSIFFAGLAKEKFLKSFNIVANNGLLKKSDHHTQNISNYDPKAINCIKKDVANNNVRGVAQKIQLPPIGFSIFSESLYNQQIFFSPRSSRAWLFSKNNYEKSLESILMLVGQSAYNRIFDTENLSKIILSERLIKEYNNLPISQLKAAHNKAALRYYVVENKRPQLSHSLLCTGDLFHVYDLSRL